MTGRTKAELDVGEDQAELCAALCDPDRLRALERSGLGAASDPEMDFFASWVRRVLSVPAAAVTLVRENLQVIPGAAGLGEPLTSARSVPLSHSLCQWVIMAAEPLVIADTRADPRTQRSLAVTDFGMLAYAGVPLTDRAGHVLGSLCAVDDMPREWSTDDIDTLTDIARACSTELRLRLAGDDTSRELDRRAEVEAGQRQAIRRSQTLLAAAEAFTAAESVTDVRARTSELMTAALAPAHLDLLIREGGDRTHSDAARDDDSVWSPGSPVARVVDEGQVLHYPDRDSIDRAYPGETGARLRSLDLQCVVAAPLFATDRIVGAVLLGWSVPNAVEPTDLLTIATLAGYSGYALGRATRLSHRTSVAHELQSAMITTLPQVDDLPMAASYRPADLRETVGGDWYDAVPLVDPARPQDRVFMVSVGDIVGHSLAAVTVMGQTRCMLRQAAADNPGGPPSVILESFEAANEQFDVGAAGTAVVAQLRRDPHGRWSVTWTNAGHPAPILLPSGGEVELLDDHDALFGFGLTEPGQRTDHQRDIAPGSVLFLYTDGLVERRDSDFDTGLQRLVRLLASVRQRDPQTIVDTVVGTLAGGQHHDDVVVFAIRVPSE